MRVSPPEAVGGDTRLRVKRSDLGAAANPVVDELVYQQVLLLGEDEATKEETVELAHEALVQAWKRMKDWLAEDRGFLLWLQGLQLGIAKWEDMGRDEAALLHGAFLEEAERYRKTRAESLTYNEYVFIAESARADVARREADRELRQKEADAKLETIKVRKEKKRLGLRVAALLAGLALSLAVVYPFIFHREKTLIYLGLMPRPYAGTLSDDFPMTPDRKPNGALWDYPPEAEWQVEKGEGTAGDDGALLVKSALVGVVKVEPASFYDFVMDFKVRFTQGTSAAWLFRTQSNNQKGYLFVLEKQSVEDVKTRSVKTDLVLTGYIYRGLNNLEPIDARGGRKVPLRDCCRGDDGFRIRAEVKGYEFRYWVALEPYFDPGKIGPDTNEEFRPDTGVEYFIEPFEDERSMFRYGGIGLLEPYAGSQMKVEYLSISPAVGE